MSMGIDCFPSLVTDKWIRYNFSYRELRDCFKSQSRPFVSWIPTNCNKDDKLYYQFMDKSKVMEQHEQWCLKSTETTCELSHWSWDRVSSKLRKPIRSEFKNSDQRMCFRYCNVFLTKCHFTFGFRTVPEGQYHLYQTSRNPIYFYKLRDSVRSKPIPQRSFHLKHYHLFEKLVMVPDTLYCVPPGTSYVLITCKKTLFALDVVKRSTWKKLKRKYEFERVSEKTYSPLLGGKKRSNEEDVYSIPPPTPAMDQLHDFSAVEEEIPTNFTPDASAFFKKKKTSHSEEEEDLFKIPFPPPVISSLPPQEEEEVVYEPEIPVAPQPQEDPTNVYYVYDTSVFDHQPSTTSVVASDVLESLESDQTFDANQFPLPNAIRSDDELMDAIKEWLASPNPESLMCPNVYSDTPDLNDLNDVFPDDTTRDNTTCDNTTYDNLETTNYDTTNFNNYNYFTQETPIEFPADLYSYIFD